MNIGKQQLIIGEPDEKGIRVDDFETHCGEVDVIVACACGNYISIYTTYSRWRCTECGKVYWIEDPVVKVGTKKIKAGDSRIYDDEMHQKNMKTIEVQLKRYAERNKE